MADRIRFHLHQIEKHHCFALYTFFLQIKYLYQTFFITHPISFSKIIIYFHTVSFSSLYSFYKQEEEEKMDSATRRGPFCYTSLQRKSSLTSLSSMSSSSSSSMSSPRFAGGRKYSDTTRFQQQPHFLDACFLCNKPLGFNRDIFMYRSVFLQIVRFFFQLFIRHV